MITEKELDEAIRQYENADDPTAQTCITLAAFYAVRDHLFPQDALYDDYIYSSDSDFGQMVGKRDIEAVLSLMDELMETLRVLQPPLYESVMQRLSDI